ncbi:proline dehydrogenase family protein [Verrucomicrobiota bacterium sgz303538]
MRLERWPDPELIDRAVDLASLLQRRATELQTPGERRQQAEIARMVQSPSDKATLMQLTDQAFRSNSERRVADQFRYLLRSRGIPSFFSRLDHLLLELFRAVGHVAPVLSVPLARERVRRDAQRVILPAERNALAARLEMRRTAGIRMNVNFLGEALLGEQEAMHRMKGYIDAVRHPEVEVLSIKISTIYSQISPVAREYTLSVLCDRLEQLYRESVKNFFRRADGARVPKFVYLDMEEYRDMSLTAEAFMRTLDRRGMEHVSAGIALQAYLPDSFNTQRTLYDWARRRAALGGAPITIRLVKGANLEMERVDAALHGWSQAPFKSKLETDANYKRMLHEALLPEHVKAARVGVASHNLFDVAYALILTAAFDAGNSVQFEMLEGMASHQRRALFEQTKALLLYAPACRSEEFVNAIGYLIRRLDENTAPENFLRHTFHLTVGSEEWHQLESAFRESFTVELSEAPRRSQNRLIEAPVLVSTGDGQPDIPPISVQAEFDNEPDTDFALPRNGRWAAGIIDAWHSRFGPDAAEIPLVIDGEERFDGREPALCQDPSRPGKIVARYREATEEDINRALDCARRDADGWRGASPGERSALLMRAAVELRQARGALIGAGMANAGKTVLESDPEVSEAVDFAEFYARSAEFFFGLSTLNAEGKGVAVVVPPWNFPISIPCGGIAAALAAGNTVIIKPASPAVLVAWELCQCFWRSGISRRVLQFLPCPGAGAATRLVADPRVDAVVLTGGTATALELLRSQPTLPLFAETGGKNVMIVTAMSDREQAIKHAVHSAFSHSGQKCSATSLLLLEAEVYDDPHFRDMLVDAASSLPVGSAWELHTRVNPLIRPPRNDLERGLTTLEPSESWALQPRQISENPHLWSPGIKYGVVPGSYTHQTEFFGPVLGVMRFETLGEAIRIANSTGYGLTAGLQSLDEREISYWKDRIRAGNLYANKPTVGAIVLRQPFGGMAKSCFGPGMHAGGPNYVAQFIRFREREARDEESNNRPAEQLQPLEEVVMRLVPDATSDIGPRIRAAFRSYERVWNGEFSHEHDHFRLLGEDNVRRYLPMKEVRVRIDAQDSPFQIAARIGAALITGTKVVISASSPHIAPGIQLAKFLEAAAVIPIEPAWESDEELASLIRAGFEGRVRYGAPERVPLVVREAAAETAHWIADTLVTQEGRVELLWYLQEQSISYAYHRYGNLGPRADEERRGPA